jgi:hypothetical protein
MKNFVIVVLGTSLCVLFFIACVHTAAPLLTEDEYSRLDSAAGNEWYVHVSGDEIVIESKELFWFYNAVSLPLMTEEELLAYIKESGRRDHYKIILLFVPRWDEKKVADARDHNNKIWKQISQLPQKYGLTHLSRNKQNSFFPETKADEVKIKEYEAEYAELEAKLIMIPDYYSEGYSIFWQDNRQGFEAVWAPDLNLKHFQDLFSAH